jgi:hypothetical protein
LRLGIDAESGKQRQRQIHSRCCVPIRDEDSVRGDRGNSSSRQCGDGGEMLELL